MTKITLKGNVINTNGELPKVGSKAVDFKLTTTDLATASLSDYKDKRIILNIFPSVDTGTCATSVRSFNKVASNLKDTVVLCVSRDLPFAQKRFCGAEGIENVIMLSDFNTGEFSKDYGLQIIDGPLNGLSSRSIVIIDKEGNITYTEQVAETVDEPNYDKALAGL